MEWSVNLSHCLMAVVRAHRSMTVAAQNPNSCCIYEMQYCVEMYSPHRGQVNPRRRRPSRRTFALVSSLSPLFSIFLRRRVSLRPSDDGGVPEAGSTSFPFDSTLLFIVNSHPIAEF